MDPITLALIGGGLGLGKYLAFDQPAAAKNQAYQAAVTKYSPWTGMHGTYVPNADAMTPIMQGGIAGASLGQSIKSQDASQSLQAAQMQLMQNQQNQLLQQAVQNGGGLSAPSLSTTPSAYQATLSRGAYKASPWSVMGMGNSNFSM